MKKPIKKSYGMDRAIGCRICENPNLHWLKMVEGTRWGEGDLPHWRVECLCGVCGRWCRSDSTAIDVWNELQSASKLVNEAYRKGIVMTKQIKGNYQTDEVNAHDP